MSEPVKIEFHVVSIHAPLTGSDVDAVRDATDELVSIHAPLTGSDA